MKPDERLAGAMTALKTLQDTGSRVFRSDEIGLEHLTTLLDAGYVQRVMKGWYHLSKPGVAAGDTTPWAMHYWEFISKYCNRRFGDDWTLGAEASLVVHAQSQTTQKQIVVVSPGANNNNTQLPHGSSLFDLRGELPPTDQRQINPNGIRLLTPVATITRISENTYRTSHREVMSLLGSFRSSDELALAIVEQQQPIVGGRIIGAMRHLGMNDQAERIERVMRGMRMEMRIVNPFDAPAPYIVPGASPIVTRLRSYWADMAPVVKEIMPESPPKRGLDEVLNQVDEKYTEDAWHSLSIEGYRVTEDLIEKIREGRWNPEVNDEDKATKDALAAKGYHDAFQEVREYISNSISGRSEKSFSEAQSDWHSAMFYPSVTAKLLELKYLVGYRKHPVFIQTAQHVPPQADVLMDAMDAYHGLIDQEESPAVKAVLGHWMLGYIHPYFDGNGRLARFTMNAMLVIGGYDWAVIHLQDRKRYMQTLDNASAEVKIAPFAQFIADQLPTLQPQAQPESDSLRYE